MKSIRLFRFEDYWPHLVSAVLVTFALLLIFYYGRQANAFYEQLPVKLTIYAFSTQEEVFTQGILPRFKKSWEEETGQEIEIEIVYGPSATLAGDINLGAPADVAIFSNAYHVNFLKMGRKVKLDTQPIVIGQTPLVIVTRPGNPHNIRSFADLAKFDLCLLHADPHTSGVGQWAILAEYGSSLLERGSPSEAKAQMHAIWDNVSLLGASARAIMALFELDAGDALITYEQDALLAQARGVPMEIVYPPRTIIAQHIAVAVDDNIILRERPVVQAFMDYLLSESAQRILGSFHLRPINIIYKGFPPLSNPFNIEDLGGWPYAYSELVEKYWKTEIEPRLDLTPTSLLIKTED